MVLKIYDWLVRSKGGNHGQRLDSGVGRIMVEISPLPVGSKLNLDC